MKHQLFWFAVVGFSALIVHFCLVSWLLVPLGLAPLVANIIAFVLAFQVSYWGHRKLTFKAQDVAHSQSLPRFFGVACLSFVVNEALYALLLKVFALNYQLSLLIVLLSVAALTFVLSKLWAFAQREQHA